MFKTLRNTVIIMACAIIVFSCTEKTQNIESELPDPLAAGWQGATVCEVIQETATVRMLKCTFPPGSGHERHYHAAHVGYTLAGGRMRITDSTGTREVDTKTGGSFYSDGVAWHEVLNIGDSTAVFLIIEPK